MSPAAQEHSVSHLLNVPDEVLHHILTEVNPQDLGRLSQSCQRLYSFIGSNQLLYKEIYLKNWDDPIRHDPCMEFEWRDALATFTKCQNTMLSSDATIKKDNIAQVTDAVLYILKTSHPQDSLNIAFLQDLFDEKNRDVFLYNSSLFQGANRSSPGSYNLRCTSIIPTASEIKARQLSAKLDCLYGITQPVITSVIGDRIEIHAHARSKVYDLRTYTEDGTFWGPFLDDGTEDVDWEKVESIMIVLWHNLQHVLQRHSLQSDLLDDLPLRWTKPWLGVSPNSFVPLESDKNNVSTELDKLDPFGVTGTWLRIVSFLDYTDFYDFNFNGDPALPRAPLYTHEASRMIVMKIYVTKLQSKDEEGNKLESPIVHFRGTSSSMLPSADPDTRSNIRGIVRFTSEGEVRWTSWSIFHGEERWRSEGIQVGGAKSARGVIGTWFDKDFDDHGPAGPTAFWKISNNVNDKSKPANHSDDWL